MYEKRIQQLEKEINERQKANDYLSVSELKKQLKKVIYKANEKTILKLNLN
jgi:hypothetical protein